MVGFGMFDYGANDPVSTAREAGKSLTAARREVESRGIKDFLFLSSSPEEFDQRAEFDGVSDVLAEVADKYLGSSEQRAKLTAALRREFVAAKDHESKVAQQPQSPDASDAEADAWADDNKDLLNHWAWHGFSGDHRVPSFISKYCDYCNGIKVAPPKPTTSVWEGIKGLLNRSKTAQNNDECTKCSGTGIDERNAPTVPPGEWQPYGVGDRSCYRCDGTGSEAEAKRLGRGMESSSGLRREFVAQQPRDPQKAKEKAKELTHPGTIRGHESLNKSNRNESVGSFSEQIVNERGDSPKERGMNEKHRKKGDNDKPPKMPPMSHLCKWCGQAIGSDVMGTWIDDTGGNVCGSRDVLDDEVLQGRAEADHEPDKGRDFFKDPDVGTHVDHIPCPECGYRTAYYVDPDEGEWACSYCGKHGVAKQSKVAGQYVICPTCEGEGTHVNPAIDAHGLSAEDFDEDPDFAEDYFRGTYDVPCAECGGNRVVPKCTECEEPAEVKQRGYGDRRDSVSTDHYSTCYDHLPKEEKEDLRDTADMYAEMEAERRMGA